MARTKQTARKATGGKRPRVQMSTIIRTPKADEFLSNIQELLYRSCREYDPLKLVATQQHAPDRKPPAATEAVATLSGEGTTTTTRRTASTSWRDQEEVLTMLMQHHISAYMDIQAITLYRLTSATNWNQLEETWARTVCHTFLLTTDMKEAAEQVVRGGWKAFLQFLSPLAHNIQRAFAQLGLSPPPLYRALVAQQAIRRLDRSPHPLLWSDWCGEYKGKVFRSHWRYQVPEFTVEVQEEDMTFTEYRYGPQTDRVASLELCFGPLEREREYDDGHWYDHETIMEYGQVMMPDEFILEKQTREPKSQNQVLSKDEADALHLLSQHVAWVALHGREGSRRRQLASEGKPPFIFLAKDDLTEGRCSFWVITLDDDDEPVLCFFVPEELGGRSAEQPFLPAAGVPDINSWFFARSDLDDRSWMPSKSIKYDRLQWGTLAKSLRIRPFAEEFGDPLATFASLRQEDEALQLLRRRIRHSREQFYEVDLDEEPEAIVEYLTQLDLVVRDV